MIYDYVAIPIAGQIDEIENFVKRAKSKIQRVYSGYQVFGVLTSISTSEAAMSQIGDDYSVSTQAQHMYIPYLYSKGFLVIDRVDRRRSDIRVWHKSALEIIRTLDDVPLGLLWYYFPFAIPFNEANVPAVYGTWHRLGTKKNNIGEESWYYNPINFLSECDLCKQAELLIKFASAETIKDRDLVSNMIYASYEKSWHGNIVK